MFSQIEPKKAVDVNYKENVYHVEDWGGVYSVTNKKYRWSVDEMTAVKPIKDEGLQAYYNRVRKKMYEMVDSIIYSAFTSEEIAQKKNTRGVGLSIYSYWYAKTGDYAGVHFTFDSKLKDIVTIAKIYEMEQRLRNAHLNAGRQDLVDSTKKYFHL